MRTVTYLTIRVLFMSFKAKQFVFVLGACLISACTSVQPTYTATGNQGFRVNCGGVFGDGDLGSCYQSAGDACKGAGYRIMQSGVSSMIVECRTDNLGNNGEQAQGSNR